MNRLICPNCGLPFTANFANCFEGNILECPHCNRGAMIRFKGRIIEGGKTVIGGMRYLISTGNKGK